MKIRFATMSCRHMKSYEKILFTCHYDCVKHKNSRCGIYLFHFIWCGLFLLIYLFILFYCCYISLDIPDMCCTVRVKAFIVNQKAPAVRPPHYPGKTCAQQTCPRQTRYLYRLDISIDWLYLRSICMLSCVDSFSCNSVLQFSMVTASE